MQDIGKARILIDEYPAGPTAPLETVAFGLPGVATNASLRRERLLWTLLTAVLLTAAIAGAVSYWWQGRMPRAAIVAEILPPGISRCHPGWDDIPA